MYYCHGLISKIIDKVSKNSFCKKSKLIMPLVNILGN